MVFLEGQYLNAKIIQNGNYAMKYPICFEDVLKIIILGHIKDISHYPSSFFCFVSDGRVNRSFVLPSTFAEILQATRNISKGTFSEAAKTSGELKDTTEGIPVLIPLERLQCTRLSHQFTRKPTIKKNSKLRIRAIQPDMTKALISRKEEH